MGVSTDTAGPFIVGLCGRAGSRKDVAAELLVDRHGFSMYSLATPLRDTLVAMDPLIHERVRLRAVAEPRGWDFVMAHPEYGPTVRRYMVGLGQALKAQFGPQVLIEHLHRRLVEDYGVELAQRARVVISDVRLAAEAQFVEDLGGRVINIVRPDVPPIPYDLTTAALPERLVYGSATADGAPERLERQLLQLLELPNPGRRECSILQGGGESPS